ncbi:MAG: PaaI family thioesterase [Vicinamibacterales bacterium]
MPLAPASREAGAGPASRTDDLRPPVPLAEPGWTPVNPFAPFDVERAFLVHRHGESRVRLAYYRRDDGSVAGKAWFGTDAQGPPGHAHGGSLAAVLDEVMSAAAWVAGHPIVVARIAVDFRAMLPLGTDATFESRVERVEGRKVFVRGRLRHEQTVFAEGEAVCVVLDETLRRRVFDLQPDESSR